ncbi:MAG: hypothetical protein F6K58_06065 [Symploca sp. SIO2E9]|nr:hypothetical protein [Symploca sp. SIO2E9]
MNGKSFNLEVRNKLEDAIAKTLSENELIIVLRRIDQELDNISSSNKPYPNRISDLLQWLEKQDEVTIEDFLNEAKNRNSNNSLLKEIEIDDLFFGKSIFSNNEQQGAILDLDRLKDPPRNPNINLKPDDVVSLLIQLTERADSIDKDDDYQYYVNTRLAIPRLGNNYDYENLRKTFKENKGYTQKQIEAEFNKLIRETNLAVEEIKKRLPIENNQYFQIAIEWILPDKLLSLNVDCWKYDQKNQKIACDLRFHSVHVRSAKRLSPDYNDCRVMWQRRWNFITTKPDKIKLFNYLKACENLSEAELKKKFFMNDNKMIVGINFSQDSHWLENGIHELIIKAGIPIVLWSRYESSEVNHTND